MSTSVEYVRDICNKRKIPISQLEKDCGFANGYLNPKKLKKIPYDRAKKIATYLNLSLEYLLNASEETEEAPAPEDERKPGKDELMAAFWGGDRDLSQEDLDAMWADVEKFAAFVAQKKREEKRK